MKISIINADAKKLGPHPLDSIVHFSRVSAAFLLVYVFITAFADFRSLALGLESIGNETADTLTAVASEMKAMRQVVLQNRMALDYLVSAQGGTCAVIGHDCCTFLPDESANITNMAAHIKEIISDLGEPEVGNFADWLTSSVGGFFSTIIQMGITGLGMLIVLLIVVCARKMCTACCVECCPVCSRKAASKIMVAQIKPQTKASKTDDYFIALGILEMSDM